MEFLENPQSLLNETPVGLELIYWQIAAFCENRFDWTAVYYYIGASNGLSQMGLEDKENKKKKASHGVGALKIYRITIQYQD